MADVAEHRTIVTAHWDWVLWRYNREFLAALRERGRDVVIVCPRGRYTTRLENLGLRHVEWDVTRRGGAPWTELRSVRQLAAIYRDERPQLAWHLTVKPSLYGSLAAHRAGAPDVVNTYTGLGFLFGNDRPATLVRRAIRPLARRSLLHPNVHSIVLNPEDRERLVDEGWTSPPRTHVIPSSGVDTSTYHPPTRAPGPPFRALLAARLLEEKGVRAFVEAGRILQHRRMNVQLLLAGEPDHGNPNSIRDDELETWRREGLVEVQGHVDDMPPLLRSVHAAVLPTRYNEGVPSFLLEAAATGLPLVSTNSPGCRLVVEPGRTGLHVPPDDPEALADAIGALVSDPVLAAEMGRRARQRVVERFTVETVVESYLQLHDALVPPTGGP